MSQSDTIIKKQDMPNINTESLNVGSENKTVEFVKIIEKNTASNDVMPQLDHTSFSSQIFWLILSFSILYFIIARICVPSIMEVRINRKEKIDRDLDRADRFKEESVQIKDEYESFIKSSNREAGKIVEEASTSSDDKIEMKIQELEESTSQKIQEAEENIEKLRQKAVEEISTFSADLSVRIVEKISGVKVSEKKALEAINNNK